MFNRKAAAREARADVIRGVIHDARNGAVNGLAGSPGTIDVVRVAQARGINTTEHEVWQVLHEIPNPGRRRR